MSPKVGTVGAVEGLSGLTLGQKPEAGVRVTPQCGNWVRTAPQVARVGVLKRWRLIQAPSRDGEAPRPQGARGQFAALVPGAGQ